MARTSRSVLDWLTVERALYGVCALTAAALRFHDLGRPPLGPGEAAAVWPAWLAATGTAPAPATDLPTSALLFSLHWLSFWLTGVTSEAITRWPAALTGTSLVLLPWALRPLMGQLSALVLAVLLAIDPVLVDLSRRADGASLSAFAGMLAFVMLARHGLWRYEQSGPNIRHPTMTTLSAMALGLVLVSGTQAWSLLILLALVRPIRAYTLDGAGRQVGIVLLTAIVVATTGFAQWEGPPLVSVSLGAWLRAWTGSAHPGTALASLASDVVRTQPLLLALALVALASVWHRSRPGGHDPAARGPAKRLWSLRSAIIVLAATALAVGQADTLAGRLGLVIVLAFLAARAGGRFVGDVAGWLRCKAAWRTMLGLAVTLAIGLLVLVTLRASLNGYAHLADGIRYLSRDVGALCAGREGTGPSCRIEIVANPRPDPVLGWYLRDLAWTTRWVSSPALEDEGPVRRLIVSHAEPNSLEGDGRTLSPPAHYVGGEYRIGGPNRVVLWVPAEEAARPR